MRVQQSPMNTMRCYVSRLVHKNQNHDVRSVLLALAQALVDQACRADPSAAGCCATLSKLNGTPGIVPDLYNPTFHK